MASDSRKISVGGLPELAAGSDLNFAASSWRQLGAYLGAPSQQQQQPMMYRKWTSPMLANEFSLETLAEATYVKLSQELAGQEAQILSVFSTSTKARGSSKAGTNWSSWLKKRPSTTTWNGRDKPDAKIDLLPSELPKSKSEAYRTRSMSLDQETRVQVMKPVMKKKTFSWLSDADKRWPQGW